MNVVIIISVVKRELDVVSGVCMCVYVCFCVCMCVYVYVCVCVSIDG